MIGVPLLREGTPIGALTLTRSAVRPFTDKQIELLTTFADQAVIAIENVRLFDEVQARTRELSEALEQQTATAQVLQVISSSPGELEPVFQTMLANAVRICEGKSREGVTVQSANVGGAHGGVYSSLRAVRACQHPRRSIIRRTVCPCHFAPRGSPEYLIHLVNSPTRARARE